MNILKFLHRTCIVETSDADLLRQDIHKLVINPTVEFVKPFFQIPVENGRKLMCSDLKGKDLERFQNRIEG